jgi:hypothetical protein
MIATAKSDTSTASVSVSGVVVCPTIAGNVARNTKRAR